MNEPKISIIVPIFNGELYLEQCLNSLINQTFKNIEIICVNDGSTDNSMKILEDFREKDPRIQIISQENQGVSVARNNGMNHAIGEFILFVDSDDWLDLNACDELYFNAVSNGSDIVLFNSVEENETNPIPLKHFSDNPIEDYNIFSFDYTFDKKLLLQSNFSVCSKLFRNTFLNEQNLKFNGKLFENISFHVISISKANKISYLPEILYHFRVFNHLSLNMISNNTSQAFVLFDVIDDVENYLISENLMENYRREFALFKIDQLRIRFEKTTKIYKEELFKKIKDEFLEMEMSDNDFADDWECAEFYYSVINSHDSNEVILSNLLSISDEIKMFDSMFNEFNDIHRFGEYVSTDEIFNDLLSNNFLNMDGYEKIKDSELFNNDYYKENYNADAEDPLLDYIYRGVSNGFNPNTMFNNEYFLNSYPKIKDLKINPFIYFILYGQYEGKFNFNQRMNPSTINRRTLKHEINSFNDLGVTEKKRDIPIIVSLTSFNKRINQVYFCIYSLLTQSLKPDYVVLWLAEEEFKNKEEDLPDSILNLRKNGLVINWFKEDIKSFKKLIPSLQEYPNSLIVTADDDIYYPENWLKMLYEEHQNCPESIVCHRSRKITFEPDGSISPYNKWMLSVSEQKESFLNFPTCGGGALFPPNSLYKDVSNKDLFLKLTPHADDIWFWTMMVLNKTKIKVVKDNIYYIRTVDYTKELKSNEVLWELNSIGGNDIQLKNILNFYPELIDIISKD